MLAVQPLFVASAGRSIAFWVTFAAWFGYLTVLLRTERPGRQDEHTSAVLLVCTVGGLAAGFAFAYWYTAATIEYPAVGIGGLLIVWASLALGEWSRRRLGTNYHPVLATDDAQHVVIDGPYRVIRHPIYASRILCLIGLGLAMANWVSLAVCAVVPAVGFAIRIKAEEQAMLASAGAAYSTYAARTRRLIPGIW